MFDNTPLHSPRVSVCSYLRIRSSKNELNAKVAIPGSSMQATGAGWSGEGGQDTAMIKIVLLKLIDKVRIHYSIVLDEH